jgi:hypothetical protein
MSAYGLPVGWAPRTHLGACVGRKLSLAGMVAQRNAARWQRRWRRTLVHRGPDDFGIWADPGARPEDDPNVRAALAAMGVACATVPLRRASLNPVWDAARVVALAKTFRQRRTDAILVCALKPVIYGSIAARFAGVRAAMITGVGSARAEGRASGATFWPR